MTTPSRLAPDRRSVEDVRVGRRVAITASLLAFGALSLATFIVAPLISDAPPDIVVALILVSAVFAIGGVVAWDRRPENWAGPYMTLAGIALVTSGLLGAEPPIVTLLALPALPVAVALIGAILLAFPTGRLTDRGDRWLIALLTIVSLVDRVITLLLVDTLGPDGRRPNPFRIVDAPGLYAVLNAIFGIAFLAIGLALVWRIARRWQSQEGPARRSVIPILAGGLIFVIASTLYVLLLLVPATTTVAQRLQFVQIASLAAIPIGVVVGLLRLHLAHAGLVDHVIRLRDVPPDRLRDSLATALDDPTIRLLWWDDTVGAYVDEGGASVPLPEADARRAVTLLEANGTPSAALIHDPALLDDPGLIASLVASLRLIVENQRLQLEVEQQLAEVRASRARIVEAADSERRAVERDLHDGAQQRLISVAVSLQMLRAHASDGDSGAIRDGVDAVSEELRIAIKELRELTRGVHPAILADAGIGPALQSLADRSPVPVLLDVDVPDRLAPVLEATVYFIAAETLTNTAKYAEAAAVQVEVSVAGRMVVIEISDNGRGGADASNGSGLRGLHDRVLALGGNFAVISPPDRGTTVHAEIPVE